MYRRFFVHYFILVASLLGGLLLAGCKKKTRMPKLPKPSLAVASTLSSIKNPEKQVLIVFVHGSILGNSNPHIMDRRFSGAYQYQAMDKLGLRPITGEQPCNLGTILAAENYARAYKAVHGLTHAVTSYTFGWDGALDAQHRLRWAKNLYIALIKELKRRDLWQKPNVEIEVHGFSHGGNVALNLALAEEEFYQGLSIDRLCLWGLPVQQETGTLVGHSIFKKVHHYYSKKDRVQIVDVLSTSRRRSYKCFDKVCKPLPSNLYQIEIQIDNHHPNHYEFWYLGSKESAYRKYFPLYPLPLVHFTPALFQLVEVNAPKNRKFCIKGYKGDSEISFTLIAHKDTALDVEFSNTSRLLCALDKNGISSYTLYSCTET